MSHNTCMVGSSSVGDLLNFTCLSWIVTSEPNHWQSWWFHSELFLLCCLKELYVDTGKTLRKSLLAQVRCTLYTYSCIWKYQTENVFREVHSSTIWSDVATGTKVCCCSPFLTNLDDSIVVSHSFVDTPNNALSGCIRSQLQNEWLEWSVCMLHWLLGWVLSLQGFSDCQATLLTSNCHLLAFT